MKMFTEMKRELPIIADVDVLVCGSGPAGIGAAMESALMGMSCMVVEIQNCLGGIATAGLMSHWGGVASSKVLPEIKRREAAKAENLGLVGDVSGELISHETEKIVLEEMFKEANIDILYATMVCDAIVEENKIIGVIVENKSGRGVIIAKRVVDATCDGDVAARAGVPFTLGREEDNAMQPATLMFKIGGVDFERACFPGSFETEVETEKGELQTLGKKILPFLAGHVLLYRQTTPGTVCCNMTNVIKADGTNAKSLTDAIIEARSQIEPIVKFLKEYAPGYENCWLMSGASLMGVRETRHFKGLTSIEADDILEARYHEDWIVRRAFFNFDVHNITGNGLDKTGIQKEWKQSGTYTIPFGCVIPEKVDNLLLSGRNISGSHLAHSNFRIMSVCMALGEAAGVIAALSIKNDISPSAVDVKEVQNYLGK